MKFLIIVAGILVLFLIVSFMISRIKKKKTKTNNKQVTPQQKTVVQYVKRESIMTACEWEFYRAIRNVIPSNLLLVPQVNLATLLVKISDQRYQNELYRNIDFCIFDTKFKPLCLIEINDNTHKTHDRIIRDQKVKSICEESKLPLITLWVEYGINPEYIKSRIFQVI